MFDICAYAQRGVEERQVEIHSENNGNVGNLHGTEHDVDEVEERHHTCATFDVEDRNVLGRLYGRSF